MLRRTRGLRLSSPRIFEILERKNDAQIAVLVEPRLLAYIKSNDYLPGSVEGACRVGNKERRSNTAIGQLLIAE
jgi:hypothetical protein